MKKALIFCTIITLLAGCSAAPTSGTPESTPAPTTVAQTSEQQPAVEVDDDIDALGREIANEYVEKLDIFWLPPFASTEEIDPQALLVYSALMEDVSDYLNSDGTLIVLPREEAVQLVEKYFGLADYNGTDTEYYDAASDSYLLPPVTVGDQIQSYYMSAKRNDDGTLVVNTKADVAETGNSRENAYTLQERENGEYYFVSMERTK